MVFVIASVVVSGTVTTLQLGGWISNWLSPSKYRSVTIFYLKVRRQSYTCFMFDKVAPYVACSTAVSTSTSRTVDVILLLWQVFWIVRVDTAGIVVAITVVLDLVYVEVSVNVDRQIGMMMLLWYLESQYTEGLATCSARVDIRASQATHSKYFAWMIDVKVECMRNNRNKRQLYIMLLLGDEGRDKLGP